MNQALQKIIEGKYEILQKIREGGMGSIYKVRHRLLDEVRVIKVLQPDMAVDTEVQQRFHREAKTAIRLRHPNIAQIYDFSVDSKGTAYIVMEYIDGVTFQELLRRNGLPTVAMAVELASQGLKALEYLHSQEFVHRDIAPDNLMLTRNYDDTPLVKLIDLGIAKALKADAQLTATGAFLGKVHYSAPEQFSSQGGAANVTRRSDLYSFGVLFYELLTGKSAIGGKNFAEIVACHLFQPPLSFDESDPEGRIPENLRQVVLRALEKKPKDRMASAGEFRQMLSEFRGSAPSTDELERTLETVSTVAEPAGSRPEPGSTQSHLDEQFKMEATPREPILQPARPPSVSSAKDSEQTKESAEERSREVGAETAVKKVSELLAGGDFEKAAAEHRVALAAYGDREELTALQEEIDRVETTNRATLAGEARGARETRRLGGLAILRSGRGLMTLAILVLVVAVLSWTIFGRSEAPAEPSVQSAPPAPTPTVAAAALEATPAPPTADTELPAVEPEVLDSQAVAEAAPAATRPPGSTTPKGTEEIVADRPESDRPRAAPQAATRPESATVTPEPQEPSTIEPKLIDRPEPQGPSSPLRSRDEVVVYVRVLVDENGRVTQTETRSEPPKKRRYMGAAEEAAKEARFEPGRRDSELAAMWTELRYVFNESGAPGSSS